ncbi:MAG TPA: hypothetical protein VHC21_03145 [Candidatus Saccharimonadales bacterium]|nr:hypothetical protein [Candidatus Saccharimonadales bacterium]
MAESNPHKPTHPLSDEALAAAFAAEHQPSFDQKWAQLHASDAPFVRQALARAEEIRAEELDAGAAYLQGIADFRHELDRQELIKDTRASLRELSETPEVDPGE